MIQPFDPTPCRGAVSGLIRVVLIDRAARDKLAPLGDRFGHDMSGSPGQAIAIQREVQTMRVMLWGSNINVLRQDHHPIAGLVHDAGTHLDWVWLHSRWLADLKCSELANLECDIFTLAANRGPSLMLLVGLSEFEQRIHDAGIGVGLPTRLRTSETCGHMESCSQVRISPADYGDSDDMASLREIVSHCRAAPMLRH